MTPRRRRLALAAAGVLLLAFAGVGLTPKRPTPAAAVAPAFADLQALIRSELADKGIPAISVALVDGDRVVWSEGFGTADPDRSLAAAPDTVYRAGSVSKLFTDVAIMRQVEMGALDLDAPIEKVLPDFHPKNPFGGTITLRELMSHRSGLVREPPVGHYFDSSEPSLAATVGSLNDTELVYAPDTHTKYSNAGVAVAGYALETATKQPFSEAVRRAVLEPLAMDSSAFEPGTRIRERLAKAVMWGYDGRVFPAPEFQLGMAPAGSLYTTVLDLSKFLTMLFERGGAPDGSRILRPDTLEAMWTPRVGEKVEKTGYGIGFRVSRFDGHRAVGHDGAIYGFATSLLALPDDKLGAVAIASKDAANAVTDRIVQEALRLALAARARKKAPAIAKTEAIPLARARDLAGRWGRGDKAWDVFEEEGEVSALAAAGRFRFRLRERPADKALVADGPLAIGQVFEVKGKRLKVDDASLPRVPVAKPQPPADDLQQYVGEYGWDYDVLYVLEKEGALQTLIEWFEYDPLTPVATDVFRFPDRGLYDHETFAFVRDGNGRVSGVRVGAVFFPRRAVGPEEGKVFRIQPARPPEDLRKEALAATPPAPPENLRKPELVELVSLDPTIKLDVRYATPNNFLGVPLYTEARAFLQKPAAEALVRVHQKLAGQGYGLLVHDAYRPWYVTKMFWDGTPEAQHIFVADPKTGSRHNRGCAVDLTLFDRATGAPLVMTGTYDEFSDRSFAFYPGGTALQRWQRDLLRRAMDAEGFAVYQWEWWHFDYKDWNQYPVMNVKFEEMR